MFMAGFESARHRGGGLPSGVQSRGRNVCGASTITQQVMKNILLSGDRTGERKIQGIDPCQPGRNHVDERRNSGNCI